MDSVSNNFVWRFNALSGQRIFIPGEVGDNSCGFLEENDPELADDVSEGSADLELQLACDQYEQQRKKDRDLTFVGEDICMVYPSSEAPQNQCPVVTMRQQATRLSGKDFSARMRMFDIAYQTNALFTISVKPRDPSLFQLWYQRRCLTRPSPNEALVTYSKSKTSQNPQAEDSHPIKQMGFLKPCETFSSSEYGPDPIFDKIDSEVIQLTEDIQEIIAGIEDPQLKENVTRILTDFLEDDEAESVALLGHDNGRPFTKLIHKI
jgi:hypothetical protein